MFHVYFCTHKFELLNLFGISHCIDKLNSHLMSSSFTDTFFYFGPSELNAVLFIKLVVIQIQTIVRESDFLDSIFEVSLPFRIVLD